jgi:hypothetical protein
MAVIAAPDIEDRRTLRREFPNVTPYPRSRGSMTTLPYEEVLSSTITS